MNPKMILVKYGVPIISKFIVQYFNVTFLGKKRNQEASRQWKVYSSLKPSVIAQTPKGNLL